MYHPMLTLAVAQTRFDDLTRDLPMKGSRRRLTAAEAHQFDAAGHRASLARRLARYAGSRRTSSARVARHTDPSVAWREQVSC